MALKNLSELRTNIATTIRDTQVPDLINSFLNLTLSEIGQAAPWTWLRRKTTFSTVVSQESYNLDEEVDRIAFLRQITTPRKLMTLPDHLFYQNVPDPENLSTGNPRYYRLWEETGFSTQNTSAEKVTVVSSSTSDTSKVVIVGRESTNNLVVAEEITLNGTTAVSSTNTYAIGGLLNCSKAAATVGTITIKGATSSTTFSLISPEEIAPRFKRLSLFPIPSSAITMYLEYYERIRLLVNDGDVPQLDHKWNWVLREGALAKSWEYKQNDAAAQQHLQVYLRGLELMRRQDQVNLDYVPVLAPRSSTRATVIRTSDSVGDNYPSYSLVI